MVWFFGLLPVAVFLLINPILETYLAKDDRYRTQSVYGFRSTKAVSNYENWQKAQLLVCSSSLWFGVIQLLFTVGSRMLLSLSDEVFLIVNCVVLFSLFVIQFFYVNSKLD